MRHKSSMKEAQNDNEAAHRGRRWLQREANRGENCSVIMTRSLLCLRIMRGVSMQAADSYTKNHTACLFTAKEQTTSMF